MVEANPERLLELEPPEELSSGCEGKIFDAKNDLGKEQKA
jgi:hypothetical protein